MNICLRICIDFKGGVNQPDLSKVLSYTTVLNIQPSLEAYLRQISRMDQVKFVEDSL